MEKKIACLTALLLAAGLMAGCGNAEVTNRDLNRMNVEDYVTVGDYADLQVSAAPPEVDAAEWDQLTLAFYSDHVDLENGGVVDRAVAEGDTVNIDYEGKRDGVAFGGGTAAGADLTIGSGRFIDGFEDGLIGVTPGETVDLDLAFPEGYDPNPELAGVEVVFTVKVNFIYPSLEEMEDSVVASMGFGELSTVEGLRRYLYDYLMEKARMEHDDKIQDSIMDRLMENSEFEELPEAFLESYRNNIRESLEDMAGRNGVTADTYTNYLYKMSSGEYVELFAEMQARQELLLQAIANREGLAVDDGELEEKLEEFARDGGSSVEELLRRFDREDYRNYFMRVKVMEFLVENVDVTE